MLIQWNENFTAYKFYLNIRNPYLKHFYIRCIINKVIVNYI
jgi:hypothetical protein